MRKKLLVRSIRQVAQTAQIACLMEVTTPKLGNVNRHANFADTSLGDFLISAVAIGPAMERASQNNVGKIIWQAVKDTKEMVSPNTNLGIVLLLSPLVKACSQVIMDLGGKDMSSSLYQCQELRKKLSKVLNSLTVEDARWAYEAIRLAHPGGLGNVAEGDVSQEPAITLYEAMALAQNEDSIAREYVTNFAITFELGYPILKEVRDTTNNLSTAIVQTYLTILSKVPDTLILRKKGADIARQVSSWASDVLSAGGVFTNTGRKKLADLDHTLRDQENTLNPGTTADLTTAAIFLSLLYKDQ